MFCVNCGKSLIRGYQFCIECGTPVTDMPEEENGTEGASGGAPAAAQAEPPEAENGSLVFCPNCGMHMQVSTAFCEMCGLRLSGDGSAAQQAQNVQPAVPLWNENPLGDELSGMSESDIDRINNFMNGVSDFGVPDEAAASENAGEELGGAPNAGYPNFQPDYADIGGSGGYMKPAEATREEIDALAAQLAQYSASAAAIPTVSASEPQPVVSMQEEIGYGEGIRMQNFSMEAAEDEGISVSDGVPIISGGSMDEDPNDTAPINPYGFLDNDFGDIAPTVESISPSVENIAPAVENITPFVEDIAPSVPTVDYAVPTAEDIGPAAESAAPAAEVPVSEVPAAEENIYARNAAVEAPADNSSPYEEVPAYPSFDGNSVIPERQTVGEDTAASEESAAVLSEQSDNDFMDYGEPYIAEGLPVIAEYNGFSEKAEASPLPAEALSADAAAPSAESAELKRPENEGRKITYCHNCGQDMYEDEQFCKNCNAPRNAAYVPAARTKSKKLIPIIAAAAVVVAGAAVTVFVLNGRNTDNVIDNETLSVSDPVGNNAADPADTCEVSDTSAAATENTDESSAESEENIFPPAPVTSSVGSETEKTPKPTKPSSASTTPKSSAASPKATTPKPATTPKSPAASTTPKPAATPKPATTPSTPATTPKPAAPSTISSAKVTSLEKDRKAITDAVAVIAGEVGKIEALAQNVVYAMENSSNGESARTAFYSRDFAKNMLSSIDSGKTAVDNAVSAAAPDNSEFDSAYDNLVALQGKYEAYYKFIKSPSGSTSKFSSSCGTYLSGVTSYINSNFKYSSLTVSAYTSNDTALAYKSIMSDAVAAANSAISGFSSVEGSLSALDGANFDTSAVKELSKSAVSKNYANAAANAQKVAGYVIILSGAPSEYSSAYNSLKSASGELTSLVDLLVMIQENTLDTYSESSRDGIDSAKSAINTVKKAVS